MINISRILGQCGSRLFFVIILLFPALAPGQSQLAWHSLQSYMPRSQVQLCPQTISKVCYPSTLAGIYNANNFYPIWGDKAARQELMLQLKLLVYADLVPGLELRLKELRQLQHYPDQRAYDLVATDSFLVYQAVIEQLQAKPSRLFKDHTINIPKYFSLARDVELNASSIQGELLKLRPQAKRLESSIRVAEKLHARLPHDFALANPYQLIRKGQPIPDGFALIDILLTYGDLDMSDYLALNQQAVIINEGAVNQAIKAFQRRNGLDIDGLIGPATARQLALPYAEVARLIALNLQRSRFETNSTERPVIKVNIPDFMLRITQSDKLVFESKVIVGRTSRPTYLFSSSLNTMVVNPSWNVPTTIKQQDVIPKVKDSLDYLQEKNLKIVKSWRDRSVILPDQIEWSMVNPKTFPYEFQQDPGPSNALGKVKFLMPNDYSIFLHDTPSRSLFRKSRRNLSSGCVRVEKADELAEFIIDYQRRKGIAPYQQMVSDMEPDTVSLGRRVNVDVVYLTAWIDENEQLQVREDIYGYDRPGTATVKPESVSLKDFRY